MQLQFSESTQQLNYKAISVFIFVPEISATISNLRRYFILRGMEMQMESRRGFKSVRKVPLQ